MCVKRISYLLSISRLQRANSGHILDMDKSMQNMRFMTNMNDQYINESDNEEDSDYDVEDIDSGKKIVNYFNYGNSNNNDDVFDSDNNDNNDDGIMGKED
jgi:hypothetical protein